MIAGTMTTILLATSNRGKIRELQHLLPDDWHVESLADHDIELPEETGATLAENAAMKALVANKSTGLIAVGDDSGLEVDALDGQPGVRSARFAGEPPDEQRNIQELLRRLAGVPPPKRRARFRCSVAVAKSGTIIAQNEGVCEGEILTETRGTNGFGYDPVFLLPDGRTMAELSIEEKNRVSHRAAALRGIATVLLSLERSPRLAEETTT